MSRTRTGIWLANVFLPLVVFAALNWYVAVRGHPNWRLPFEVGSMALSLIILAAAGVSGSLRNVVAGPSPVRVSVPGMVVQMPFSPVVGQGGGARRAPSFLFAVTMYYLVALVLRLFIYGLNEQIWGKATLVVAVAARGFPPPFLRPSDRETDMPAGFLWQPEATHGRDPHRVTIVLPI